MSKYYSVVILDGISTTACIYMASDCAHEEISVFVELAHSLLHRKRNPQQAKIYFVAESAILLPFIDLLCNFGFHKQIPKSLYRSKLFQKYVNLGNSQQCLWNPEQFVESTIK